MGFLRHFIRLRLTALLRHIVLFCINPVTLPSPNRQLPLGNCNQALLSTQLALSAARKSRRLSWKIARGDRRTDTRAPRRGVPRLPGRRAGGQEPRGWPRAAGLSGKEETFGCQCERAWPGCEDLSKVRKCFC